MSNLWKLVLQPVLLRAGTALATWLVASGVGQTHAEQITTGLVALALVLADLFAERKVKKEGER